MVVDENFERVYQQIEKRCGNKLEEKERNNVKV